MEDLNTILEKIDEKTKLECIKLSAKLEDCTQFDSKVGGTPYIPNGFEYPYSKSEPSQPLMLLAQINFDKMPYLKDYPTKGILQFYLNPNDDCYGMNWDNPTEQDNFRIIYHESVDYSANNLDKIPKFNQENDDCMPFEYGTEAKLTGELYNQGLFPYALDDFDDIIKKSFKELYPSEDENTFFENNSEEIECFFEKNDYSYHAIGGYPNYTQNDVRTEEHSTLLFQLDTDDDINLMWGDCGIGNFFINLKDLKNLDFSNVLYNWDCC